MIQVTPKHIVLYSKCPKRCQLSWESKRAPSLLFKITKEIINLSYLYFAKREEPIPWKLVLSQTQSRYTKSLGKLDEKEYQRAKGLIGRISDWYSKYYLGPFCDPGITNVPIALSLGNNYYYKDYIPLLITGKELRIIDYLSVDDKQNVELYNGPKLYNDLLVHTRIWGFRKAAEIIPSEYIRYVIGEKITAPKINVLEESINKTDKVIRQILSGIKDGVFYPSISDQCNLCPYKSRCSY